MSLSSLPPMPRFAGNAAPSVVLTEAVAPALSLPLRFPEAGTFAVSAPFPTPRRDDGLRHVPPAPRATTTPAPAVSATSALPASVAPPELTDDDLVFMQHIVTTPGAHFCPPGEGCVIPRALLGVLLDHLERAVAPPAPTVPALPPRVRERVESVVRNAFHDAFVAVGGSTSLMVINAVFAESPTKARLDALLAQLPPSPPA